MSEAKRALPWRATIRREDAAGVADAIRNNGGVGVSRCSMAVVSTADTPTEQDVICWMGPGASQPDDIVDARLIAASPDLLAVVELLLWNFPDLDEILGGQSGDKARELIKLARAAKAKATDGEGKP